MNKSSFDRRVFNRLSLFISQLIHIELYSGLNEREKWVLYFKLSWNSFENQSFFIVAHCSVNVFFVVINCCADFLDAFWNFI